MTELLLLTPILAPVIGAAFGLLLRHRPGWQLLVTAAALLAVIGAGVRLTFGALSDGVVVTAVGADSGLKGIALVADPFGAALVVTTALLALLVVATTVAGRGEQHRFLYPLFLVLVAGACGSFVAGDLFNLFVLFEVALAASYVLLVLDGGLPRVRAAAVYIPVNLFGTMLLLAGVAGVFAAAGTVNLALLAEQSGGQAGTGPAATLVVAAFAIKAGLLPFTGWLVVAYSNARRPVMALFVGSMSTIGVAALYRVVLLSFGGATVLRDLVLVMALATLVVTPLAALASSRSARALALLVATQVGFMAVGFGLGTSAAVAAGVFFVLQDILVKTALIVCYGPVRAPDSGARASPLALALLAVLGLSLAGFPPLTGFVGKALLVEAAFDASAPWVALIALAASGLTLAALLPLWREARDSPGPDAATVVFTTPVALGVLAFGLAPYGLISIAERSAEVLLDPSGFAHLVLGGSP